MLLGSLGLTLLVGWLAMILGDGDQGWTAQVILSVGVVGAILPAACLFQFHSRPVRFGSSLAWASGAFFVWITSLPDLLQQFLGRGGS